VESVWKTCGKPNKPVENFVDVVIHGPEKAKKRGIKLGESNPYEKVHVPALKIKDLLITDCGILFVFSPFLRSLFALALTSLFLRFLRFFALRRLFAFLLFFAFRFFFAWGGGAGRNKFAKTRRGPLMRGNSRGPYLRGSQEDG